MPSDQLCLRTKTCSSKTCLSASFICKLGPQSSLHAHPHTVSRVPSPALLTPSSRSNIAFESKEKVPNAHLQETSPFQSSRVKLTKPVQPMPTHCMWSKSAYATLRFYHFGYTCEPHSWVEQRDQIINMIYEITQHQTEL